MKILETHIQVHIFMFQVDIIGHSWSKRQPLLSMALIVK